MVGCKDFEGVCQEMQLEAGSAWKQVKEFGCYLADRSFEGFHQGD